MDGGGEIGVAVVVGVDSCERSGELEGIERASMLPGNVGYVPNSGFLCVSQHFIVCGWQVMD